MKALIDPTSPIVIVESWKKFNDKYYPVKIIIPNSARVCQIEPDADIFGVAEPLFWQDCTDQIIPDVYYFELQTQQYILTPPSAPYPNQPIVEGVQTI
jgi:hypothetical protein